MKFIDIGANLTHESFSSDLTAILEDARKEGVIHVILTGTDLQTNLNAIKLTKKYSSFLSSQQNLQYHLISSKVMKAGLCNSNFR